MEEIFHTSPMNIGHDYYAFTNNIHSFLNTFFLSKSRINISISYTVYYVHLFLIYLIILKDVIVYIIEEVINLFTGQAIKTFL